MLEEKKDFELKEEELEKISGGDYSYNLGDRKSGPCKYCGAKDSLVYIGINYGWERGQKFRCNVFKCEKCGNDSYYTVCGDQLLM